MKPACVVAAVVSSLLSWLTWGSTGPLTNLGYHDFFGAGFVYVFAALVGLMPTTRPEFALNSCREYWLIPLVATRPSSDVAATTRPPGHMQKL